MKRVLLVPMAIVVGCGAEVNVDPGETAALTPPPVAEFDPANKVIPLPNNLVLDPQTEKLNLPAQCNETPTATALREKGLNVLDGFGTSKTVIQATFSKPVDPATLPGRVFLLRLATAHVPADGSEGAVPIVVLPGTGFRFDATCTTPTPVDNITIVPTVPLKAKSTYVVALRSGIQAASGEAFLPSATWGFVRQREEPVALSVNGVVTKNLTPFDPTNPIDLASIQGIDQLWKAHAAALRFLDAALPPGGSGGSGGGSRDDLLLAWHFNTETISDPFDATSPSSPASQLTSGPEPDEPLFVQNFAGDAAVTAFYQAKIGPDACTQLPCAAIGSIHGGVINTANFQMKKDSCVAPTVPGAWPDPLTPKKQCTQALTILAVVPKVPAPGPNGYKAVIYAHGITRTKGDLLALAGQLASQGIASIAVDAVNHGDRAIPISTDAAMGCANPGEGNECTTEIGPSCASQCYAPILSPDLPTTRDNLRQTVLDNLKLERVLKFCGTKDACGDLFVDPNHIGFVSQSLGSIIGSVTVAVSPTIKTAVLDVGAADWVQVFSFTKSDFFRCSLIDGLIGAQVLQGQTWDLGQHADALCLSPTRAWAADPGYQQFATVARWVLDPVDGVNYANIYHGGGRNVLLQEVKDDEVVPNEATEPFGMLLGLTSEAASVATGAMLPPPPTPSAAKPGSAWITYSNQDPNPAMLFPGNKFSHGSMLKPAGDGPDGKLGTAQMQTDVVTYLVTHL